VVTVRVIRNKARATVEFSEKIDMAENDNILTKLFERQSMSTLMCSVRQMNYWFTATGIGTIFLS
jgi:hypothetical protein